MPDMHLKQGEQETPGGQGVSALHRRSVMEKMSDIGDDVLRSETELPCVGRNSQFIQRR